jgi:DNA-binding response OmpR family regulator
MASILLVEDAPIVLNLLRRGLEEAGHQVDTASDACTGLARCLLGRYDLVITDLWLATVDAIGWLRQVRALWPDVPIMIVSGTDCGEVHEAVEAANLGGVASILQKPFPIAELTAIVRKILAANPGAGDREPKDPPTT